MSILVGLLALVLTGDDGPPGPFATAVAPKAEAGRADGRKAADGPAIGYEVRYVAMGSLDWRGRFDTRLRPVARRGGAAVWSADAATFRDLLTYCQEEPHCNVIQAPKAVAPAGGAIRVVSETSRHYVAHLKRRADGPVDRATKVAFEPELDEVREGLSLLLSHGQPADAGLLARVALDETRFVAFHTATHSEAIEVRHEESLVPGLDESTVRQVPVLNRLFRNVGIGRQRISAQIQVPEVVSTRVEGEWLIPKDGVLIVGLGPCSRPGKGGQETLQDRLVVIGYRPVPTSPAPDAARAVEAAAHEPQRGAGQ
jgi:hypothetical protein